VDPNALPNVLGFTLDVLGQAPGGGDWVNTLLTATGPAGAVAAVIFWFFRDFARRADAREVVLLQQLADMKQENRDLTGRLFRLADRGMEVGKTASEVAREDVTIPAGLVDDRTLQWVDEVINELEEALAALRRRQSEREACHDDDERGAGPR
jgi:hypothetical protein